MDYSSLSLGVDTSTTPTDTSAAPASTGFFSGLAADAQSISTALGTGTINWNPTASPYFNQAVAAVMGKPGATGPSGSGIPMTVSISPQSQSMIQGTTAMILLAAAAIFLLKK